MKLLDSLLPTLGRLGGRSAQPAVQLTFSPALTQAMKDELAKLPAGTQLALTPSGNGQVKLQLPSGLTLTASTPVPLPQGMQVQITAADILSTSPKPNAPGSAQAQTIPVRITLPQTAPVTPNQPQQPAPQPILVQSADSPITHAELRTIHTTTILQTTTQQAAQTASITTTPTVPQTPLPMPPGPVAATLPPKLPATLIGQLLSLTTTAPMQPDGTQQATLTPATPTPGQLPQRTPVTLNLGVPLPTGKPFSALLLPPAPANAPDAPTQPVLVLNGQQATPAQPQSPHPQLVIQKPQAATTQPAAKPLAAEPSFPIAARILPPAAGQPPTEQTALLATGTTITVKSPQPLPTGSIIVADFPITPTSGIQRVLQADSQAPQQQGTQLQTQQGAATQAPQPRQATLSAGMVITGQITGQNEEGQPILTITQPGALAGATVPLTLAEPTTLLPLGAQLSIKVGDNMLATILGLTLPAQAQNAFTVNTLGSRWEGLQHALQTLQQQAPVQAANMRAALPQLANLLPGLIQFTNALRNNNTEDAFDTEATRLLKSMGIDLSSDISQLSQLQQRPASQDPQWRGTIFPYVEAAGEDPRQGGFFWRREKSDDARSSTTTRFVVELEMSQIGAMQLDGLVTYPDIWLKLRRTSDPEPGFTENLQALVSNLLQSAGLNGGIAVESTTTFPVNPRAELLAHTDNPLPTTA